MTDPHNPEHRGFVAPPSLLIGVTLAIVALLYTALLWSGFGDGVGFCIRHDSILMPLVVAIVFFVLSRRPPLWALVGLMLLSTILCGLMLSGVWSSGVSDHSLMAGLFPFSDSSGYLTSGEHLLNAGQLTLAGSRRPLASGIWAPLLFVCQGNVRCVLALAVFLCALSIVLPVRATIQTHGWVAGYVVFLALIFFYRRFIGTFLSEHFGLLFGCLGFTLLWRSLADSRLKVVFAALVITTLALCVRAGAFFTLPALALWAGLRWRGQGRFSWRAFALACAAVGLGFSINSTVLHLVADPRASFGNFAHTAYGLVHGGDWRQVLIDHPEVSQIPKPERYRRIYEYTFDHLKKHPMSLVTGSVRAYGHFFFSLSGPYSFVRFALEQRIGEPAQSRQRMGVEPGTGMRGAPWNHLQQRAVFAWMLVLSALAAVGGLSLVRSRRPESALLLAMGIGLFLSVPFLPPWDADLARVYAASIPLLAAFPALGLAAVTTRLFKREVPIAPAVLPSATFLLVVSTVLAPLLCLSPILFRFRSPASNTPVTSRAPEPNLWRARLLPGSTVHVGDGRGGLSWSRGVSAQTVQRHMSILRSGYPHQAAELSAAVASNAVLALVYEEWSGTVRHVAMDRTLAERWGHDAMAVTAQRVLPDGIPLWWRIQPAASDGCAPVDPSD